MYFMPKEITFQFLFFFTFSIFNEIAQKFMTVSY